MGLPKRRISPAIRATVDCDRDRRAVKELSSIIQDEPVPYSPDRRGQSHQPKAVLAALILMAFFVQTYAGTEARLKDSTTWTECFGRVPSKSVLQEKMQYMKMKQLRRILKRLISRLSRRYAADSSGFRCRDSCRWFDVRIGRKNSKKDYLKLHILVDVETGFIADFHLSTGKAHDSPPGRRMLQRQTKIELFCGDGAYANRKIVQLVADRGGISRVAFRKDVTAKPKSHPAWKVTVKALEEDEELYKAEYHIRSFIEAVFSSIKRRFGRALRSIKGWFRRRELALKVLAYNVRHALYWAEADARKRELYETCF